MRGQTSRDLQCNTELRFLDTLGFQYQQKTLAVFIQFSRSKNYRVFKASEVTISVV